MFNLGDTAFFIDENDETTIVKGRVSTIIDTLVEFPGEFMANETGDIKTGKNYIIMARNYGFETRPENQVFKSTNKAQQFIDIENGVG